MAYDVDEVGPGFEQQLSIVFNTAMQMAQMKMMYGYQAAASQARQMQARADNQQERVDAELDAVQAAQTAGQVSPDATDALADATAAVADETAAQAEAVAEDVPAVVIDEANETPEADVWGATDPDIAVQIEADTGATKFSELDLGDAISLVEQIDASCPFGQDFYAEMDAATAKLAANWGMTQDTVLRQLKNAARTNGAQLDGALMTSMDAIEARLQADRAHYIGSICQMGMSPEQMGTASRQAAGIDTGLVRAPAPEPALAM